MRTYISFLMVALLLGYSASATVINVPTDYPAIQTGIDSRYEGDTVPVSPCERSIVWGASHLPSGIYFARLVTGGRADNIKIVLMK